MFALLLAALISQPMAASPAPSPIASSETIASPSPAPEASPPLMLHGGSFGRRMPIAMPQLQPGDAMIRNSGSTNTAGYVIVVHPDYSADVYAQGSTQHKTLAEPQAKWLFAKLHDDLPLSGLSTGHCMKSASFGSFTTVAYEGQSTGDLSCGGGPEVRELNRTIAVIIDQLGVPAGVGSLRRHLL